jgi:hypothetical protein
MLRSDTQIAIHRQEIARRYLRGEYQSAIAVALGIDQATVSRDLAAIRAAWLASAIRDFDAARAQELAKVDAVEREYWTAWERSKLDKEIATQEAGGDGKKKKISLRKEGQSGNPAYLAGILTCIERRCKILGLDAPARFNVTINWDELSGEQIDRLAAGEPPEKVLAA